MVNFDEPNKFNWTIKYCYLNNDGLTTIAEGKYYDFIPQMQSAIILENINYVVSKIIYDFDNSAIIVCIAKLNDSRA